MLALDTSCTLGSVAIGRVSPGSGDAPVILGSALVEDPFQQAARLVPAIDEALRAARLQPSGLAGIVVGEGPGSFTGVRVAAASAKGLAFAWRLPLMPVSSLAGAALGHDVGPVRYVLFDARADRVYGACYGIGSVGMQELVPPHGGTLRDALAGEVPPGSVFLGDGALRHGAVIEGAGFAVAEGTGRPIAEGLLACVALRPREALPDPSTWEPAYVRPSSAVPSWSA